jgi:hypothetical protein
MNNCFSEIVETSGGPTIEVASTSIILDLDHHREGKPSPKGHLRGTTAPINKRIIDA